MPLAFTSPKLFISKRQHFPMYKKIFQINKNKTDNWKKLGKGHKLFIRKEIQMVFQSLDWNWNVLNFIHNLLNVNKNNSGIVLFAHQTDTDKNVC